MNRPDIPSVTTDQMREVDRLMVEEFHVTLEQMMENAGRNLADLAMEILGKRHPPESSHHVVVACGTGNNGGGGIVAARFLSNRGLEVTAVLAGSESRLKPVPAERWKSLKNLPVTTIESNNSDPLTVFKGADLIIDAIFGYGLSGAPKGIPARVIREILNSQNGNVLSLDVPSGLDSTNGSFAETCILAMATMTLALPKTGLLVPQVRHYVGELYLADIGVPPTLYEHIGLTLKPLFTEETIIHLNASS